MLLVFGSSLYVLHFIGSYVTIEITYLQYSNVNVSDNYYAAQFREIRIMRRKVHGFMLLP